MEQYDINEVTAGKMVHVILDNYAAHKHPKVRAWLDRHERFVFHFTPTSCSWLNAVEGFFARLSRRRLKRGVFRFARSVGAEAGGVEISCVAGAVLGPRKRVALAYRSPGGGRPAGSDGRGGRPANTGKRATPMLIGRLFREIRLPSDCAPSRQRHELTDKAQQQASARDVLVPLNTSNSG